MISNKFTWIPFFQEVHEKIHSNYNAEQLANIANEIFGHIKDIDDYGNEESIQEMTPINFIGYFNRYLKLNNKIQYCQKLKEIMKLTSETPIDFNGIPEFNNQNCLCMKFKKDRADYIVKDQWDISKEILNNNINPKLFDKILSKEHPCIGLSYLSRFCFIVKPNKYYPFDKQMVKNLNVEKPNSYSNYVKYCNLLKEVYNDKTPYELSDEAFKQNKNFDYNGNELTNYNLMNVPKEEHNMKQPLNQILYGPPGTGKTYNTILKAMSIIDNTEYKEVSYEQYTTLKKRFDEFKQAGQIEFVTFHQSYSYEEFVEGIKPYIQEWGSTDNTEVRYIGENGIFKNICVHAKPIVTVTTQRKPIDFSNTKVFKMSLGNTLEKDDDIYDYCIKNNVVSLGWKDVDFSNCKTSQDFKDLDNSWGATALERFVKWIDIGDIIIISNGNQNFRAIAQVKSDYIYDKNTPIPYTHFRKVEWLYKGEDIHYSKINNKLFSQQSIYGYFDPSKKGQVDYNPDLKTDELNKIITGEVNREISKPHILIIDEINRGNISKIFGELITLIEEDKRIGEKHQMKITLPYSKESFGVPKNLYIIGTMNTADRSIALLDTALRRRFDFEEIMPRPELLSNETVEGTNINLRTLLTKINERITDKYDRDHQIGHSYLMEVKTKEQLERAYKNRILPLLNEYFYNEAKTVAEVLNCSEDELNKADFIKILTNAQGQ